MRAASWRSVRCNAAEPLSVGARRAATPQVLPPPCCAVRRREVALSLLGFLCARPPGAALALDAADGANVLNGVLGAYGLPTLKARAAAVRTAHNNNRVVLTTQRTPRHR
jgi:hypothetical protein